MSSNGTGGAPVGNSNRRTHGLHALKARGLDALDHRSKPYRDYVAVKAELASELGGPDSVTRQEAIAIDAISRELLFLDHCDSWLMARVEEPGGLLIGRGRRKELLPLFKHRDAIVKRVTSLLGLIGLERRERPVQSLSEYISTNYPKKAAENGDTEANESEDP